MRSDGPLSKRSALKQWFMYYLYIIYNYIVTFGFMTYNLSWCKLIVMAIYRSLMYDPWWSIVIYPWLYMMDHATKIWESDSGWSGSDVSCLWLTQSINPPPNQPMAFKTDCIKRCKPQKEVCETQGLQTKSRLGHETTNANMITNLETEWHRHHGYVSHCFASRKT